MATATAYEGTGTVSDFGLLHAASLATIERSALVSTAFVVPGKHVLQVREPFRRFVNLDDRVPPSVELAARARPARATNATSSTGASGRSISTTSMCCSRSPASANPDAKHLALMSRMDRASSSIA